MINKQLAKAMIEIKRLANNKGRSDVLQSELREIIKDIPFYELEKIINEEEKPKGFKANGRTYDIEINFDELMKKHKVKRIPDNIFRLIREVMDIMENKYEEKPENKLGRSYGYENREKYKKAKEALNRLRNI